MYKINEGCNLYSENLFSFRGTIAQRDMASIMNEMKTIINENGASVNGQLITATHSVNQENGRVLMDVEIMYPIDKTIELQSNSKYRMKPMIKLNNAVCARYEGHPAMVNQAVAELNKYISVNGLVPITTCYNVMVRDVNNPAEINDMIIEMYIGVSGNVL